MTNEMRELLAKLGKNRKAHGEWNYTLQTQDLCVCKIIQGIDALMELDIEMQYLVDEIVKESEAI